MTSKQIYQEILGIDVLKKIKQGVNTESYLGKRGGRESFSEKVMFSWNPHEQRNPVKI